MVPPKVNKVGSVLTYVPLIPCLAYLRSSTTGITTATVRRLKRLLLLVYAAIYRFHTLMIDTPPSRDSSMHARAHLATMRH